MPPTPTLSPDELIEAAAAAKSIEALEEIGRECFHPYAVAIAEGVHTQSYVKNLPGKQGYTAAFRTLNAEGLKAGVNSRDGKHHVFQDAHYDAVYKTADKPAGEKAATRVLDGESAIIPTAQYMATVATLLQSSEPSDLIIGIAATTGRRTIEVLQIGKFSEEKDAPDSYLKDVDSDYVYRFKNPAKKRNYGVSDDEKPSFSSTSLVQVADLLAAWKTLKASAEVKAYLTELKQVKKGGGGGDSGEVAARDYFNKKWKDSLGAVVEARFSFLPGKLTEKGDRKAPTPKDLRPAFAQLTYVRDVEKDTQGQPLKGSEILFKGRVLGHYIEGSKADETLRRLSSTLSYYGYRVDTKPTYPGTMNEPQKSIRAYENDHAWVSSLVEGKSQAETFRYLRTQHEALQAEVLGLKQKLREAEPAQSPAPQPMNTDEIIAAAVKAAVAATTGQSEQSTEKPAYHVAAKPTVPTARLETASKKSAAQMKAHQWLDIVVGEVKDHNQQAGGDIWQMWALSPRMLKDISGVSQKIIKEFWAEGETEFNALNEQWQLDSQHNKRRGMKKGKVTDDFDLQRPMELL